MDIQSLSVVPRAALLGDNAFWSRFTIAQTIEYGVFSEWSLIWIVFDQLEVDYDQIRNPSHVVQDTLTVIYIFATFSGRFGTRKNSSSCLTGVWSCATSLIQQATVRSYMNSHWHNTKHKCFEKKNIPCQFYSKKNKMEQPKHLSSEDESVRMFLHIIHIFGNCLCPDS